MLFKVARICLSENGFGHAVTGEVSMGDGRSIDDGRSIARNIASLNILFHDVINPLY